MVWTLTVFNLKKLVLIVCLFAASPALAVPSFQQAFSPRHGATELIIKTIGSAKKSIRVAAYSFTSAPIAKALLEAHKKGIDIQVVLDKSQRTAKYSSYTFFKNQEIPVRINSEYAIMHNKFMIIDGSTLQLGSFNYSKAAEEKNAENVLVISDAGILAQKYTDQWQKLWNESVE